MYPEAHSEGLPPHQMIHSEQLDKEIMRGILQNALSLCMVDAWGVKMSRVWKELASEGKEKGQKLPLVLQWKYLMIHRDGYISIVLKNTKECGGGKFE